MVNEQQYMLGGLLASFPVILGGFLCHGLFSDNIEANVGSGAVNMENATTELRTASNYQKMSRNRVRDSRGLARPRCSLTVLPLPDRCAACCSSWGSLRSSLRWRFSSDLFQFGAPLVLLAFSATNLFF